MPATGGLQISIWNNHHEIVNINFSCSVVTNIRIYSNIFFRILIFVFDSWTFSESEYYSNIRIFWSEYSEVIWWKNTWIFGKQRQNLDNILWARSRSVVFIDESQHVKNSFWLKGVFGLYKNFGFQILYIFLQIYSNIFEYSNIFRYLNNIRIFSWWANNIRYSIRSIFIRRIIFDIRFVPK